MNLKVWIVNGALAAFAFTLSQGAIASNRNSPPMLEVSGPEALLNHSLNQYDDVEDPPQGYRVTLPSGFTLQAVDVDSGGSAICGVSDFDARSQTFAINGFSLEIDEIGCTVTLTIYDSKTKAARKVKYEIERVGT